MSSQILSISLTYEDLMYTMLQGEHVHSCCFTLENTPSYSFKYFQSSDIIVVEKEKFMKSLLAFVVLKFYLVLKKDKMLCCRVPECKN